MSRLSLAPRRHSPTGRGPTWRPKPRDECCPCAPGTASPRASCTRSRLAGLLLPVRKPRRPRASSCQNYSPPPHPRAPFTLGGDTSPLRGAGPRTPCQEGRDRTAPPWKVDRSKARPACHPRPGVEAGLRNTSIETSCLVDQPIAEWSTTRRQKSGAFSLLRHLGDLHKNAGGSGAADGPDRSRPAWSR